MKTVKLIALVVGACLVASAGALPAPADAHTKHHRRVVHGKGGATPVSCAGTSPRVCFSEDPFYRYAGQCTWYAAGRRHDLNGIVWGNAGSWLREAAGKRPEGDVPQVGAIAVWLPWTGGAYGAGHVAYVAAVSGSSVTVEDFNWGSPGGQYHRHTVSASQISGYIYASAPVAGAPAPPPSVPDPAPVPPPPSTPVVSSPSPPVPPSGPPPPAPAPVYVHHVTGTCRDGHCGLTLRAGPGYSSFAALGAIAEGAEVDITCQAMGETVSNGAYSSAVWDRLTNGDWVSDFYVDTPNIGVWSPPIPEC